MDRKNYHKEYYLNNKEIISERLKQYRLNNKEKLKQYYLDNKEKLKQYRLNNKEKIKERDRQYRLDNRDKINKRNNKRMEIDPLFKLSIMLRNRIRKSIKSNFWKKQNTTTEILGCDYKTVKKHLENKFIDNMSWENHGKWHIDHIKPLAKAETQEELYKLCHYTNLQPLWAADNFSKGANEL